MREIFDNSSALRLFVELRTMQNSFVIANSFNSFAHYYWSVIMDHTNLVRHGWRKT